MQTKVSPVIVYAESTPNPATMKFVANKLLLTGGLVKEYISREHAHESPLAMQLFNFPFISGVFIAGNFITVTKTPWAEWLDVTLELREFITEYLASGKTIIQTLPGEKFPEKPVPFTQEQMNQPSQHSEIEIKINELLEEYIRPAVEQDGGAIHFKSFENGILKVVLRGSCSGCPSSAVTLKAGIQGLFNRMLPEVKEVVAEEG